MSGEKPDKWGDGNTQVLDKPDEKTTEPPMYKVMLHNDHRTPREFVVDVLFRVFKKPENAAVEIMMRAHQSGFSLVGIYSFEVAESRVYKAMKEAEAYQFPLLFTIDEQ